MNIAEIAKMAGVSSAAVSRYFNNGPISEKKREAIRKVVEKTGFRPSVQAQTLRTRKTKMIGVIVPRIASNVIGKIVEGILEVLNQSDYQMLLAVTQNDPKKEVEYLTTFSDKQVDGVIFLATVFSSAHKKALADLNVPIVIVGQEFSGYRCVYHDDYHAMYDMTKWFLDHGRKNLGFLSAIHQDKAAGLERYRGYRDAVKDAGMEGLAENYKIAMFSSESGYEKAGELLSETEGLDGLLCATDSMAVGAVSYCRDHGIDVPGQLLISGQGDSEIARVMDPPIITLRYSYEQSGITGVQMLFELMNDGDCAAREVKLGYEIIENF